jgi:hypothetical protein
MKSTDHLPFCKFTNAQWPNTPRVFGMLRTTQHGEDNTIPRSKYREFHWFWPQAPESDLAHDDEVDACSGALEILNPQMNSWGASKRFARRWRSCNRPNALGFAFARLMASDLCRHTRVNI